MLSPLNPYDAALVHSVFPTGSKGKNRREVTTLNGNNVKSFPITSDQCTDQDLITWLHLATGVWERYSLFWVAVPLAKIFCLQEEEKGHINWGTIRNLCIQFPKKINYINNGSIFLLKNYFGGQALWCSMLSGHL